MSNIISSLFLEFAKFPKKEGVLKAFNSKKSQEHPLYSSVTNMQEHSLIPEILDYVFATSEDALKKRIGVFKDIFLFVDYGNMQRDTDELKRNNDEIEVAITVAKSLSQTTLDAVEEVILMDTIYNLTLKIQEHINKKNGIFAKTGDSKTLTPFFASALNNSIGWTIMFTIKGTSIF